jgi:hypothetical protein
MSKQWFRRRVHQTLSLWAYATEFTQELKKKYWEISNAM